MTEPEEAWIVRAEWINSSPTYHGPFVFAEQADRWAYDTLRHDKACEGYELGILTPSAVTA